MSEFKGNINGYKYKYDPDHPTANAAGIVYEHRAVMSKLLGRQLTSDEVVHHIDGNRANNSEKNLELHSRSSHSKEHKPVGDRHTIICKHCQKEIIVNNAELKRRKNCSTECAKLSTRKVPRPPLEEILEKQKTHSMEAIGRHYKVTSNAVRKWIKSYQEEKPNLGP